MFPRRVTIVLLLVIACAIAVAQDKASSATNTKTTMLDPFPGGVGSYWIYKGTVRQQGYKIEEQKVRWQMTTDKILHRDGATAVIVKGFPDGLDWSTGDPAATETMFVLSDDGGIYRVNSSEGPPEQQFTDAHISTKEFLDTAEPMFQWPPVVGAQPGGENCPDREDDMYCWALFDPPAKIALRRIKGAPVRSGTSYRLIYRTMPDDTEIGIVSGLGVTSYGYHHHGTVYDVELDLVEVHLTGEK